MLSIKALKPGNERYYLSLALEDYYQQGGEPPGFWLGTGATILGLKGEVTGHQLSRLFQGYSPDERMAPLVQNAGAVDRQSGWDLTFSTPKTVSVLWSAGSEKIRGEIEAAQRSALSRVVSFMEEHYARSRVGKAGEGDVPARLVIAAFPHTTSRALDPHCHFHALLLNVGVGPDAHTRTILSFPFYQNKMLLGALFRAELAYELVERLGLALSRERTWFEADGVPPALAREASTRRREVEAELGRLGLETATAAAYATLKTRRAKEIVPCREELFTKWRAVAKQFGLDEKAIESLIACKRRPCPEEVLPQATKEAIESLTQEHSHFSHSDLLRALAEAPSSLGVSVDALCSHTNAVLKWSPEIVSLGVRNGERRYTTKQMFKLEEGLLTTVQRLHSATFHALSEGTVAAVVARLRDFNAPPTKRKRLASLTVNDAATSIARRLRKKRSVVTGTLSDEQTAAVRHITQSPHRIALLSGYAGTAKTTTLQAVREAFESDGFKVIGATLSGKAARELSMRAGIPSTTIRMRELELNPSMFYQLKQHARQLYRASRKWKTSKPERLIIDSRTVLIVDEASMVGTKDMVMLATAVERGGGKLVLVGDKHQLPSIDAGGPFGSIAAQIPPAQLHNVVRQADAGDRDAVKSMPAGDVKCALANYVDKQQVKLAETRSELFAELIDDWKKRGGVQSPKDNVICAALNREIDELNDLAQALRIHAGEINPKASISIRRKCSRYEPTTTETFCIGDRITVTKKSRKFGVENGDTGTLVGCSITPFGKKVSVLFDNESSPRILPLRKVTVRRGYAFTTHKLQGATANNVFVAMTGPMLNRQMAYVQMSRHKESLMLYVPESLAEKDLLATVRRQSESKSPSKPLVPSSDLRSVLTNLMAKDGAKDLAHDVLQSQVLPRINTDLTREEAERLLCRFAERGDVTLASGTRKLTERLVAAWQHAGGLARPEKHLMFAQSERERHLLNVMAQQARLNARLLRSEHSFSAKDTQFLVGDHIRFDVDLKKYCIESGTTGRITAISESGIQVHCDASNSTVSVPIAAARVSLAYAFPAEDMKRRMPETAHVLLSDKSTDRDLSCVYQSLHRKACRLYLDDTMAGENIRTLCDKAKSLTERRPPCLTPSTKAPKHTHEQSITHG